VLVVTAPVGAVTGGVWVAVADVCTIGNRQDIQGSWTWVVLSDRSVIIQWRWLIVSSWKIPRGEWEEMMKDRYAVMPAASEG